MIYKSVTVSPYYKCGDDLAWHLSRTKDDPVKALLRWAIQMEESARDIRRIAEIIKGKDVSIDADTHHVGLSNLDARTLRTLRKEKLVSVQNMKVEDD